MGMEGPVPRVIVPTTTERSLPARRKRSPAFAAIRRRLAGSRSSRIGPPPACAYTSGPIPKIRIEAMVKILCSRFINILWKLLNGDQPAAEIDVFLRQHRRGLCDREQLRVGRAGRVGHLDDRRSGSGSSRNVE